MDDKYLDNVFREKMELPQQHDFDELAWLDLESRLEDKRKRRIIPWRWLAAAAVLLPMLMMSFYFYYELRQTEQQLAKLETKMNNLLHKKEAKATHQVVDEKSLALNDDLVENVGITRQRTTTQSMEMTSSTNQSTTSNAKLSINKGAKPITIQPKGNTQAIATNTKSTTTKNYQEAILKEEREVENIFVLTPLAKAANDTRAASALFLSPKNKIAKNGFTRRKTIPNLNHLHLIYNDNTLETKENLWERTTAFVLPVGFEVSVNSFGGTKIPMTAPLTTIQSEKPYFDNQGIEVAANFINGVDLTIGTNLADYQYITTTISQDFPNAEPNGVGDVFNNVTVTETVVQIPVGLRYNFGNHDDVFTPFVEMGGIAKRSIHKEHSFEFLPQARGENPYKIIPPSNKQITNNFAMNTASVSGGVKWNPNIKNRILDNVVIQAEAIVNTDFETPQPTWTAGVGVSANYMF